MFLAIGLAARRSRALFLSATLQGTSSTHYDVSSREHGGTLHTYAHLRPGSQCALSAHMRVDTCSDILPELPFPSLLRGWMLALLSPASPWSEAQGGAHQPRSQTRAQGSVLSPAYRDGGWRCNQPPSLKALVTQLAGVQKSTGLRRSFSALPGSRLTCPALGGPFSQHFQAQPDASGRREWATCSVG